MTGLSMTMSSSDLTAWANRIAASRWTPRVLMLVALVLLTHSLAQWTWRVLTPATPTASRSVPVATAPDPGAALRDLLAANLFGTLAPGNGAFAPETLPATSLNLELTGVMVRDQGSFALIRIDGGDEIPVTIGDEVQAGTRLHAVYPDRAVLQRGQGYESLLLKDQTPALAPGSIVGSSARTAPNTGIVRRQNNQFSVDRGSLQQQIQQPEFLSQALIVPNPGGGFLVREMQPGSIYEKLGVRVGDVIRSVNGQAVNNIDDVMKLYQSMGGLEHTGQVAVEISRGGRHEQLQYQLQ